MTGPPSFLPFVLLAGLALAEAPTWPGYRARMRRSAHDASTAKLITWAGVLGVLGALEAAAWGSDVARLAIPPVAVWGGVALTSLGALLRVWAMLALGPRFTLTLQAEPSQPLVASGPYRFIRHPSYLGGELALLGTGLSFGNWLCPALMALPMLAAHLWRIPIEERMMEQCFGDRWRAYRERTARLVPFVY